MTTEDIKRLKELDNSLSIALDINDNYQRENKDLKERIKELADKCKEAGRAMIELNMKYEANMHELDRVSEENTNLKIMMKGTDGKDSSNNS
jgi:predicted nuclease with TOPRIM domain